MIEPLDLNTDVHKLKMSLKINELVKEINEIKEWCNEHDKEHAEEIKAKYFKEDPRYNQQS